MNKYYGCQWMEETITDDSNGVILPEGVYTPNVVFKDIFQ